MESINRRNFLKKSALAASAYPGVITSFQRVAAKPRSISQKPSDALVTRLSNIRSEHPSLHFNAEGLEQLRRQAKGTHRRYADMLFEWVKRNRHWSPLDMPYPSGREVALEQSAAFVTNVALAFVLSQRDEYLQLCRRWVAEMLQYPKNGVRNYGFGIYAAGLARVYDWLYHHLTAQERQKIRTNVF